MHDLILKGPPLMSNDNDVNIEKRSKEIISTSLHDYLFQFDIKHENKSFPVFVKRFEILEGSKLDIEYSSSFEDKERLDEIVTDVIQQIIKKKVNSSGANNECHNTLSKQYYPTYFTTKNIFETYSRLWSLIIFPITALGLFLN